MEGHVTGKVSAQPAHQLSKLNMKAWFKRDLMLPSDYDLNHSLVQHASCAVLPYTSSKVRLQCQNHESWRRYSDMQFIHKYITILNNTTVEIQSLIYVIETTRGPWATMLTRAQMKYVFNKPTIVIKQRSTQNDCCQIILKSDS